MPAFDVAKMKELSGLIERDVFKVVFREEISTGATVMKCRFVLAIKYMDTDEEIHKALWVVQGFRTILQSLF